MYIVTSRDKHGSDMIIWHFKNYELALFQYKDLKKRKYPRVHLSSVNKQYENTYKSVAFKKIK